MSNEVNHAQEEVNRAVELYNKGKSLSAISAELGRERSTVKRMLIGSGVTIRTMQEQVKLQRSPYTPSGQLRSHSLTAMEVFAIYGVRAGLDTKEIAYRLGYQAQQSARDVLKSAFRKIRARTTPEELL